MYLPPGVAAGPKPAAARRIGSVPRRAGDDVPRRVSPLGAEDGGSPRRGRSSLLPPVPVPSRLPSPSPEEVEAVAPQASERVTGAGGTTVPDPSPDLSGVAFGLAGGVATVLVAGFAAGSLSGPPAGVAPVAVLAAVVLLLAGFLTDWRACAGTAVTGALLFLNVLAEAPGDLSPWRGALVIAGAALLGRGVRRLIRVSRPDTLTSPTAALRR